LSKKLFVGNLPFNTSESEVRSLLEQYGEVTDIAMILDRDTKRFRGFCFVEMDDSAADAAIAALNDQEFNGRTIKVNEAKPREDRPRGRGGNRGGGNFGGGRPGGRPGGGKPNNPRGDATSGNRRNFPSGSGHR
jgi:cold-inducible RNA-binding protein